MKQTNAKQKTLTPTENPTPKEQQLWQKLKEHLPKSTPHPNPTLLKSVLEAVILTKTTLKNKICFNLQVPSSFHQKFLQNFLTPIESFFKNTTQSHIINNHSNRQNNGSYNDLSFAISVIKKPLPDFNTIKTSVQATKSRVLTLHNPTTSKDASLDVFKSCDFGSFIEEPNNSFALAIAKNIVSFSYKNSINPLYIYGSSGLGKTHLLLAIWHQAKKNHPQKKILYLKAEQFFNECITHIQKKTMPQFRKKYRENISLLLLDDVQILGRGESIQEEFFHTYESLIQAGCQIVLASDTKPQDIKGLKNKIKTRFSEGVIADIQAPNTESKITIVEKIAQNISLNLTRGMVDYLANLPLSSVREIKGCLKKLKFFCKLQKKPLCLLLIKKLFPAHPQPPPSSLCVENLLKGVAGFFNILVSDMKSSSRNPKTLIARNFCMLLMRKKWDFSLNQIAQIFEKKDHSLVFRALQKVQKQIQKDEKIAQKFKNLKHFIQ